MVAKVGHPVVRAGEKQRQGKGFSIGEISKAGVLPPPVIKAGGRIDRRRRSIHGDNVSELKKLKPVKKEAKKKVSKKKATPAKVKKSNKKVGRENG